MFPKLKKKFSRARLFLSDFKPILLSHHPNCDNFSNHVYHIGKYRLCIGCFTFYPAIFLTILFTLIIVDLNFQNSIFLFFISYVFFLPLILNILGYTKFKFLKIFSKVSIGIGIGLYLVGVFSLPLHPLLKIISIFEINFFIGLIAYVRSKHIKKDCKQCEFKGDWDMCPGMKPIRDKLYAHGFRQKRPQST
jgi:hypothetical protein